MGTGAAGGAVRSVAFRFVRAEACAMCGAPPAAFRRMGLRLDRHQGPWARRSCGAAVTVFRCGACGLVFPDPMPVPESVAALYAEDPVAYWRPEYFRFDPDYLRPLCETVKEMVGRSHDLTALDVGAGIGKGVISMGRQGFRAVGLEPSAEFRAFALAEMGLAEGQILPGTVEDADFPSDSFDFVNFGAVLEHVRAPGQALARAVGWARPGGVVFAEVPSARWLLSRGLNAWYGLTGQGFVTNTSPMHPPYHLYEFTPRSFEGALRSLPCELRSWRMWTAQVMGPRPLRGVLRRVMGATRTGMQLAVWMQKT